jgi:GNAT superfamily N-acetyltransferase
VQKHLSPRNFARIIDEDVVLLAELGNRLIGYVQFGAAHPASAHNTEQEVRRLYVHRDFQHTGYGTMLMDAALRHPQLHSAASISLDV